MCFKIIMGGHCNLFLNFPPNAKNLVSAEIEW